MGLEGVRAVVTGGGGGLGRAFCLALARRKAKVVVSDVDLVAAERTAGEVRAAGGEAIAASCDVRRFEDVEAVAKLAEKAFGGTDLIVNNAGVAVGGEIGTVSPDDWRWVVDINLLGVAHGLEAFVPRLRTQGRGYVINVASAAGLISGARLGPYNATKAAVVAMSETLAAELLGTKIHVTVLCPTFFQTNIMKSSRGPQEDKSKEMMEKLMRSSKLQADDVAERALAAVEANQLYCVPMDDGRALWRLKRLAPGALPHVLGPKGALTWIARFAK